MVKWRLLILISYVLGACATETLTVQPFTVYRIASTPELESLVISWIEAYQDIDGQTLLQIEILPPQVIQTAIEIQNVDLIISSYGPPDGWFATPLLTEEIAVVVNPSNELQTLQIVDLDLIFSGKIHAWADLGGPDVKIQPVIPLRGEASRDKVQEIILRGSPFSRTALLAPTPAVVRQFVRENLGGIGFLLTGNLTDDVQEIAIIADGSGAENSGDRLRLEVHAIWSEEPLDALRAFLVWLQGSYLQ